MLKAGMELREIIIRKKGKLGRQDQRGTKNSFSRRQIGRIMRGGSVGQENPGQVGDPVRGSAAATEGGLKAAMKTFKDTVGLGMKSSGGDGRNVKERGKVGPKGGNKLGTAVRGDGMWNTKAGNPGGTQGIRAGACGRGRKRNSLDPAGGPINDGENVGVVLGGRKGANKVNMDVGKTTGRDRNRNRRWRNMLMDFRSLAGNTLSGPEVDVAGHAVPKESGSDKATGGPDTRMT
jgi:hypothetical protein